MPFCTDRVRLRAFATNKDTAFVGDRYADDAANQGRFACSVCANQRISLTRSNRECDALNSDGRTISFRDVDDFDKIVFHSTSLKR